MRLAILLTATATLLPAVAGTASVAPPTGGAVLVEPKAAPVATLFASVLDRVYRFTVTGTYLYDGRFGQADCGHRDPPTYEVWRKEPNFTIDGSLAQCVFLPYSATHTYTWTQLGTGKPFLLDIPDGSYNTSDDTGRLVVVIEDVR